jgi:hypothetical protein
MLFFCIHIFAPTNPHWAHVGYGPFSLCIKGQCPSRGGVNWLMMMMMRIHNTSFTNAFFDQIIVNVSRMIESK